MKSGHAIIFDFDGTLADSEPIILAIYAEIAGQKGWPKLTKTQYKKLRKGTVQEGLRWLRIRPWQIPRLLREAHKRFNPRLSEVQLFDGIPQLLSSLHKQGHSLYVLSANSPAIIKSVLQRHKLEQGITVLKSPPVFSKHKSIKKLTKKYGYQRDQTWMIGDELRDIEAAQKAGVKSIAVTWGLQDESVLKAAKPTHVATTPSEIAKILRLN